MADDGTDILDEVEKDKGLVVNLISNEFYNYWEMCKFNKKL